ncbi:hypothetical protein CYY_004865 [Polysphondylium violaceum]|uniref:Peroxisomal membrane protein PEX16 n=1 Tax=Polysphondylium violaceum TaxID=133409 RepID=A0A8J4PTY9_9MYCE|nr:hypothetical protein CYY_004865 [Polysphondylium violaceum]
MDSSSSSTPAEETTHGHFSSSSNSSTPTNSNNSNNSLKTEITHFLIENGDHFGILNSLIMFLPGRYNDSELLSESLYSITNMFQLYIDYITSHLMLSNNVSKTSNQDIIPPPYYISTLKWINIIQNVELFFEVLVSKKGSSKKIKKTVVFLIECLKAMLRLHLLIKTNGNMLVHHSFHVPSKDAKSLIDRIKKKSLSSPSNNNRSVTVTASPVGNVIPGKRKTLYDQMVEDDNKKQDQDKKTLDNNLNKQMSASSEDSTLIPLLPPCSPKDQSTKVIGELLFIFRPVIYWVTYSICGKRSWKPWFISLIIEIVSKSFSEYGLYNLNIPLSKSESSELARRRKKFLYYLIRSPFYDKFVGDGIVFKILNFFKRIPILKILVDILFNYIQVYRTRYFYTAAS